MFLKNVKLVGVIVLKYSTCFKEEGHCIWQLNYPLQLHNLYQTRVTTFIIFHGTHILME